MDLATNNAFSVEGFILFRAKANASITRLTQSAAAGKVGVNAFVMIFYIFC
jgi:hypothetical protein